MQWGQTITMIMAQTGLRPRRGVGGSLVGFGEAAASSRLAESACSVDFVISIISVMVAASITTMASATAADSATDTMLLFGTMTRVARRVSSGHLPGPILR